MDASSLPLCARVPDSLDRSLSLTHSLCWCVYIGVYMYAGEGIITTRLGQPETRIRWSAYSKQICYASPSYTLYTPAIIQVSSAFDSLSLSFFFSRSPRDVSADLLFTNSNFEGTFIMLTQPSVRFIYVHVLFVRPARTHSLGRKSYIPYIYVCVLYMYSQARCISFSSCHCSAFDKKYAFVYCRELAIFVYTYALLHLFWIFGNGNLLFNSRTSVYYSLFIQLHDYRSEYCKTIQFLIFCLYKKKKFNDVIDAIIWKQNRSLKKSASHSMRENWNVNRQTMNWRLAYINKHEKKKKIEAPKNFATQLYNWSSEISCRGVTRAGKVI